MVRPSRRRVLRMLAVIAGGGFLAGCTGVASTNDDTAQSPSTKSETVGLLHTESIVSDGLSHASDDHRRHYALIVANADSADEFSLGNATYTDTHRLRTRKRSFGRLISTMRFCCSFSLGYKLPATVSAFNYSLGRTNS